jgi:uncharacterized repeat protein (TIGR01451 family)
MQNKLNDKMRQAARSIRADLGFQIAKKEWAGRNHSVPAAGDVGPVNSGAPGRKSAPVICGLLLVISCAAVFAQSSSPSRRAPGVAPVTAGVYDGSLLDLPQVPVNPRPALVTPGPKVQRRNPGRAEASSGGVDQAAQLGLAMPSPTENFAGMSYSQTCTGGQCGATYPPDTNGDVGLSNYIQAVNSAYAVYSKTGALQAAVTEGSLFASLGGLCSTNAEGQPMVVYDRLNDHWILSHIAYGAGEVSPFEQCIAVSKTGDPINGGWYLYSFQMDQGPVAAGTLNNLPRFGVWNDGCLYYAADGLTGGTSYAGVIVASFPLADLEAGSTVTMGSTWVAFPGTDAYAMIPATALGKASGSLPPTGRLEFYVEASTNYFDFGVFTVTPGANCGGTPTVTGPTYVTEPSYNTPLTIPQPNTTNTLDDSANSDRLLPKVYYRKVGTAESLWVVHDTANSSDIVQPHWAQLSVTGGTIATTAVQQEFFAPDTTLYRWMDSIAADNAGDAAMGYSTSNGTAPNFPSIAYAGRLAGDPLNTMPQSEVQLVAGEGSQTNDCFGAPCQEWGAYSAMSMDAADDCTFWFTSEYYDTQADGTAGDWQTRIGSFKFPSCVAVSNVMAIAKVHTGNFTQGQTGAAYTITVTNNGPGFAYGTTTVADTLPAGLTATAIAGTGWTCTLATLTCTRSDDLAPAGSFPAITLTVDVSCTAPASVTNSATLSGGGDPNDHTATDVTTIVSGSLCAPILAITKTHTGNFTQGQVGAQYTIAVSNTGAVATSGTVTVADTLPAGLTATALSGTGWTCTLATLTCTYSTSVAAGGSFPAITLTVNVSCTAASSVTNSATASGGGAASGATATDPTTINSNPSCGPVLSITKTHTGNFTQGQTGAQYTINVSNAGSAATSGTVTVVDSLPAGLTATAISGTGWTCTLATLTCTNSASVAAGSSFPAITLTVNVACSAPASVTNSATASGGGAASGATATDPTTIVAGTNCAPVLAVTKSHAGNFTQGQVGAQYAIALSNTGAGATSGTVTVADSLPAGLTATAISGTGWTCTLATLTCTNSTSVAAGGSFPAITLTVNVACSAPASVTNSATASGGGAASGATATDPTTIVAGTICAPVLALTKTHAGNFTQGQTGAQYSLAASNTGINATSGTVTLTDTLPAGLAATTMSGTGWTCNVATLTCTNSTAVAGGSSFSAVTLTVNVACSAPASVTNSATASGGGASGTATATDPTTIVSGSLCAPVLAITKSHAGNFTQGQTGAQYTLSVSNTGAGSTSGTTTLSDTLPVGLTASAMSGTGWTCNVATLTCTSTSAIAAGSSFPAVTLTVNVACNAAAAVVNSATVSGGGAASGATATDPTTINSNPTCGPVLSITKTHTGNFTQGQAGAQYTLDVSNAGGAATSGTVTVTDSLPAGLTATAMSGTGWSCTLATLTCTSSTSVASGGSFPAITLTVNVACTAPASVTNSATASGDRHRSDHHQSQLRLRAGAGDCQDSYRQLYPRADRRPVHHKCEQYGRCRNVGHGYGGGFPARGIDPRGHERHGMDLHAGHAHLHQQHLGGSREQLPGDYAHGDRGLHRAGIRNQQRDSERRRRGQRRYRHRSNDHCGRLVQHGRRFLDFGDPGIANRSRRHDGDVQGAADLAGGIRRSGDAFLRRRAGGCSLRLRTGHADLDGQ